MPYIIRPNGESDLANATLHSEATLPQTISGLAAGTYEVGRISWGSSPVAVSAPSVPRTMTRPSISGDGKIGEAQTGIDAAWDMTPDEVESRWLIGGSATSVTETSYIPRPGDDRLDLTFEQRVRLSGGPWSDWAASAPITVTHVAPTAARNLSDQSFAEDTGIHTYDTSGDFIGQGLNFMIEAPLAGVSIDAATGVISIDTDATGRHSGVTVTVQATNSGGQAKSSFTLNVAAAAIWSISGEAGRITIAAVPAISPPAAAGSTGQLTITA